MAELDMRNCDPRNDGVQGGHGDDATHFSRGGHAPAGDGDDWLHEPGRASDRASTEYRGATHEQDRVDSYRARNDAPNVLNDAPQQSAPARADQYAHTNKETGGKPYNRRRG